jgi:large subunit ribosomal protein L32
MAVPKQRQSHSRTTKRRSQHKITPPSLSACPNCGSPRRSHRVCSTCGFYNGRQVVAPNTSADSQ